MSWAASHDHIRSILMLPYVPGSKARLQLLGYLTIRLRIRFGSVLVPSRPLYCKPYSGLKQSITGSLFTTNAYKENIARSVPMVGMVRIQSIGHVRPVCCNSKNYAKIGYVLIMMLCLYVMSKCTSKNHATRGGVCNFAQKNIIFIRVRRLTHPSKTKNHLDGVI